MEGIDREDLDPKIMFPHLQPFTTLPKQTTYNSGPNAKTTRNRFMAGYSKIKLNGNF